MNPQDNSNPVDGDSEMPEIDQSAAFDPSPPTGSPMAKPVLQHTPAAPVPPVTGIPSQADDIDLIEKEWVEKAKEIVDSTHGDPFTQSKQLNQIKADYIRKRYNRDIKLDE